MFGLKSYCERYGRMNDDVTLSMEMQSLTTGISSCHFNRKTLKCYAAPKTYNVAQEIVLQEVMHVMSAV